MACNVATSCSTRSWLCTTSNTIVLNSAVGQSGVILFHLNKQKKKAQKLWHVSRRGWMGSLRPKDEEIVASWNVQVPEVVPYPVTLKSFVVASSSCQLVPYTSQITWSCSTCCLSTLAWNTCLLGSSPSPLLAFQVQLEQSAAPDQSSKHWAGLASCSWRTGMAHALGSLL